MAETCCQPSLLAHATPHMRAHPPLSVFEMREARCSDVVKGKRCDSAVDASYAQSHTSMGEASLCNWGQQVEPAKQGRAVVGVVRSDDSTGK
jgi:hypothetical protein